jgi:hypothetical protein
MSGPLGLSIGTANVVAARVGSPPWTRCATLTLRHDAAPEIGAQAPDAGAVTITGFVERVGDPIPLVASDGSRHRADTLMADALAAMVGAGGAASDIAIAHPAHWNIGALAALQVAMESHPTLAPNGVAAPLVNDATAALTALATDPGLPSDGVVALLDFGASGTSLTLADVAAGFAVVDETVRLTDFSGEAIDQFLLTYVVNGLTGATGFDPLSTAAVGALRLLRDECRRAKEALSAESTTEVVVELPGHRSQIQLTRSELEDQIAGPLTLLLSSVQEVLGRNDIGLAAIATVGGGASIPVITQRLSEEFRVPVVSTPRPELNAAIGAALMSARGPNPDAATGVSVAVASSATDAVVIPVDDAGSSTFRALAWSEDADTDDDLVPYTGEDYTTEGLGARPAVQFLPATGPVIEKPKPRRHRRPLALVGFAALIPLVTVGALAFTLTGNERRIPATTPSVTAAPPPPASAIPVAPPTSVAPAVIEPSTPPPAPPPPPPPPSPPPTPPMTQTITKLITPSPPKATTPTTTTTTSTTTSTTTTTTPTPTTTTTEATPTSTTNPMTTSYITVPFVPVPIPVQVPAAQTPAPAPYAPYQPYDPYTPHY